jgi:CHAT domain-containing protein
MSTPHVPRTIKAAFDLTNSRDGSDTVEVLPVDDDDLVELDFGDGISLFTGGEALPDQVNHTFAQRGVRGAITLKSEAPIQRGVADLVIKGIKVVGVDLEAWLGIDRIKDRAACEIASRTAELADSREVEGRAGGSGLWRCSPSRLYEAPASDASIPPTGDMLVLVHGFFSSCGGAYGDIWTPPAREVQEALFDHYKGGVFSFDHPTLGVGPVENAIALAEALPAGARLHLLAHSRGGLVGELLSRAAAGRDGFEGHELDKFREADPRDAERLQQLRELVVRKALQVDRFVRAGSPMRGTWLASNRLDRWLSLFYNVVRNLVPPGPQFVADHVFDVIAAVVKMRLEREHFPGIEAMSPTSPLVALLNDAPPELRQRLTIIGGDCQGSGLLHRLKILITDGFFGEPHDLVVPTASMFGGAPRVGGARYFFHQTSRVDHFHYFAQGESLRRIRLGLIGEDRDYATMQLLEKPTARPVLTANRAAAARDDAPLDIMLPGIMGTELAYRQSDRLWVDLAEFACGNFPALQLDSLSDTLPYPQPGTNAVFPMGPLQDFYGDLADALAQRGDVVLPVGYDWRKPIHVAADALAARLEAEWPPGSPRPLRIIAHSMGGLVARSLFARHPALRTRFEASRRNRLLMLGTPNAGSMAIARALLRDNGQIRWIARIAPQSQTELLSVAATFPGFHELLPQGGRIWSRESVWTRLFDQRKIPREERPMLPVAAMQLADQGRRELRDRINTLPRANTVYVAGYVDPTAKDATVVDIDDEGHYVLGPGDGTVSYASGLLEGVPTYYVGARHGDLPSYRRAYSAYFDLLDRGETKALPTEWTGLQETRRGVRPDTLEPEQLPYRPSAEDVYRGLMGASPRGMSPLEASHKDAVTIRVVHGGLRFARNPLIVGHYQGDTMQGSEAELDRQFGGRLRKALELGVYPGVIETCQVFERGQDLLDSRSPYAIVVGLGRPGELSSGELRRSVKRGVLGYFGTVQRPEAMRKGAFSVVLLGSSVSGMTVGECARAILQGLQDARATVVACEQSSEGNEHERAIRELEIIEVYEDKAIELASELPRLLADEEFRNDYRYDGTIEHRDDALCRLRDSGRSRKEIRRLDIRLQDDGRLRFALHGIQAAVPLMKRQIDIDEIRQYARSVRRSGVDRMLGRVLFDQLLPLELKHFALEQYPVVVTLNENAASLPWEMADSRSGRPLAVQSGLVRQLRSAGYRQRERVSVNRALVIGEPDVPGLPALPGARKEAEAVAEALRAAGFDVTLIDHKSAAEIRDALSKGPWRIIHFAGHGVVDYRPQGREHLPPRTGMVIGSLDDATSTPRQHLLLLTAEDINECVGQAPELVFINCCHLGEQAGLSNDAPKLAANFANSFMSMGCRAVVAAGWAVEDLAATCFASTFYDALAREGDTFIDAVRRARACTYENFSHGSPTWGAYQCYGDPNYTAIRRASDARPAAFVTPREFAYWLDERRAASMGLQGTALDAIRAGVLSAVDAMPPGFSNNALVFESLVQTLEDIGAYDRAAFVLEARIARRLGTTPAQRARYARLCLRNAMLASLIPAGIPDWHTRSTNALDRLAKEAALDESGSLHFQYATLLRRSFLLAETDQARDAALLEMMNATRRAWGAVQEGINAGLGHAPTQDELVDAITDEQAQKTLASIVIERVMLGRVDVSGPSLPSYNAMLRHCVEKLARTEAAQDFWDDIDRADLRLLLLVTPPALQSEAARRLADYTTELSKVVDIYRNALSLSGLEGQRNSIATSMRFWEDAAAHFVVRATEAERPHWAMVHAALKAGAFPWPPAMTVATQASMQSARPLTEQQVVSVSNRITAPVRAKRAPTTIKAAPAPKNAPASGKRGKRPA